MTVKYVNCIILLSLLLSAVCRPFLCDIKLVQTLKPVGELLLISLFTRNSSTQHPVA